MEEFVKGDVIVVPFPFSDLSSSKKRPALVIAGLDCEDIILCQITSAERNDQYTIFLNKNDFKKGQLHLQSGIRPNRIFTAEKSIIVYKIGTLKSSKIKDVEEKIVAIFTK